MIPGVPGGISGCGLWDGIERVNEEVGWNG